MQKFKQEKEQEKSQEALAQKLKQEKEQHDRERLKNVTMDIVKEVMDPIIQGENGSRSYKVKNEVNVTESH